jgi:hypothetical protein
MHRFLDTLREGMSDNQNEHQPGDAAPATAHYEEADIFGNRTGAVVHVREGHDPPRAPRGFTCGGYGKKAQACRARPKSRGAQAFSLPLLISGNYKPACSFSLKRY